MEELGTLGIQERPEPVVEDPRDAVVAVHKTAICGSDLHVLHGKIPGMTPGSIIGHEFTGVVESVGDRAAESWSVGDRVVGSFLVPCGECRRCLRREYNRCGEMRALGYGMLFGDLAGAQAERVRVPNADLALMRVPERLGDEQAVFAGDILSTAYYANRLAGVAELAEGDRPDEQIVAVQGCGPVGMLTLQIARALGARRLVAVDPVAARLEVARGYGADVVDPTGTNAGVAMEELTGGDGADVVIDTAGGPSEVLAQTFDLVCPGGTVAVVGVYSEPEATIPLAQLFVNGVTLRFGGTCPVQAVWEDAIGMVERGEVDATAVISHRMAFAEALAAYELFESRQASKVVLNLNG
jgi:threonine dehydrogenase-like Zn-dependent dehydrogenase